MIGRQFAKRPSDLVGICDLAIALDFDRACSLRLQFFDSEVEQKKVEALRSTPDESFGASAPPQFRAAPEISEHN
jgi:hypothetical protein